MVAGVAVFALSGCGSGGNDYYAPPIDPGPDLVTLFLTDDLGYPVDGTSYVCDSFSGITGHGSLAGEFTFVPGDVCEFYIDGVGGELRIEDITGQPVNDIEYDCLPSNNFGFTGDTYYDGEFFTAPLDDCTLYFPLNRTF